MTDLEQLIAEKERELKALNEVDEHEGLLMGEFAALTAKMSRESLTVDEHARGIALMTQIDYSISQDPQRPMKIYALKETVYRLRCALIQNTSPNSE